jgi:hypothetical protein
MSDKQLMSRLEESRFPESNADDVAGRLVAGSIDLDGGGLVELLRLLLSRAQQIKEFDDRFEAFGASIVPGKMPDQSEFNAALQYGLYEPVCLKWFLTRCHRELSEHLDYDFQMSSNSLRPIKKIVFTEHGEVESFILG